MALASTITEQRARVDELNRSALEFRNKDPRQSFKYAEEALAISESCGYDPGKAESLFHLGFCYIHKTDHEKAFNFLAESLMLFEKLGDEKGMGDAYYGMGVLHLRSGIFDRATDGFQRSLSIREKLDDFSGIAACCFQQSYIARHFNDFETAAEKSFRSLTLRRSLNDIAGLGASLMEYSEVFMHNGDYEKAKALLEESLDFRRKSGETMGCFATQLRRVELHLLMNEDAFALQLANEGMKLAEKEGLNFGIMRFNQILGKVELKRGKLNEAKKYLLCTLKYAEDFGFRSVQFESLYGLSEIYKSEGNYKDALECYEKFHKTKEEVISLQTNTQMKSIQFMTQVEFAKKEADAERKRNAELQAAYSVIEEKQKEILDSIKYAKRIQLSLLPQEKTIERNLDLLMRSDL